MRRTISALFVCLVAPGCGDDASSADAGPDASVTCSPQSGTDIRLEEIARGLDDPILLTGPTGDARLFIVEKPGRIRIIESGRLLDTPFLDITALVRDVGDEQGLLGLAFHPDFPDNGRFFVNYTASDPRGATVVAAYTVSDDPNVASPTGQRLLEVPQFASNHNGGMIEFGPDGYLYIGMGDGGGSDDEDENGQNLTTLLGSMLRIDVDGATPYAIPDDNPFAAGQGGARPETWAYGLRNPWRWSFDRMTGDMYIGDVGQDDREEIDVQPAASEGGENYGWPITEGVECFATATCDDSGLTPPAVDYDRTSNGRCAVIGGYVYRGSCLPDLQGTYFYGDWCTSQLFAFEYVNGTAMNDREITDDIDPSGDLEDLAAFGQDGNGELYVISLSGRIYRIVGR